MVPILADERHAATLLGCLAAVGAGAGAGAFMRC